MRRLRKELGLTQKQLADLAGMRQQAMSDYEKNRRAPSLKAASKIARALGTTMERVADAIQEQVEQKRADSTQPVQEQEAL